MNMQTSALISFLSVLESRSYCLEVLEIYTDFCTRVGARAVTYHFGSSPGRLDMATTLTGSDLIGCAFNAGQTDDPSFANFLSGLQPVANASVRTLWDGSRGGAFPLFCDDDFLGPDWQTFQDALAVQGLTNILTIPVQGSDLTSMGAITLHGRLQADCNGPNTPAMKPAETVSITDLLSATVYFHMRYQRILASEDALDEELTDRQAEILLKLGWGRAHKVIAEELGLSTHVIKYHVSEINRKLGTNHIVASVAKATKLGLIHP